MNLICSKSERHAGESMVNGKKRTIEVIRHTRKWGCQIMKLDLNHGISISVRGGIRKGNYLTYWSSDRNRLSKDLGCTIYLIRRFLSNV